MLESDMRKENKKIREDVMNKRKLLEDKRLKK